MSSVEMCWAEVEAGNWMEKTSGTLGVPAEFALTVDVGWWPLDQVDDDFIEAVEEDADFMTTRDVDPLVGTEAEIKAKITEYKGRHPTTKLKRISSMNYKYKVKLADGSFTPEVSTPIGPDIWLALGGGS